MSTCTHGKELWARCIECEADMTDETKGDGMTLEQWLDVLREMDGELYPSGVEALADSIERHLAAQSAMRVDVNESQITAVARVIANIVGAPYDDYRHFTGEAERCLRAAIQAAICGKE